MRSATPTAGPIGPVHRPTSRPNTPAGLAPYPFARPNPKPYEREPIGKSSAASSTGGYTIACSYAEWKKLQQDLANEEKPFTGTVVISEANAKESRNYSGEVSAAHPVRYLSRTPSTDVERKSKEPSRRASPEALKLADLPTIEWDLYEKRVRREFDLVREAAHIRLERRLYRPTTTPVAETAAKDVAEPVGKAKPEAATGEEKVIDTSIISEEKSMPTSIEAASIN